MVLGKNTREIRWEQYLLFFFIILLGVSFWSLTVKASAAREKTVVKVAFYPMDGYHVRDEDGSYSGVEVEYLKMLSNYTDWDVLYVDCGSWDEALKMLQNKEVDLVGGSQYTKEMASRFLYADVPSIYTFGAIVTKEDSQIAFEDFSKMENLHYGMVEGYLRSEDFFAYFEQNGIEEPKVSFYQDYEVLQEALSENEIDALIHNFMEVRKGQHLIGRFASNPTHFMTYLGNEELMIELNEGITSLKYLHPTLEWDLMDKFYTCKWVGSNLLTTNEWKFLERVDEIVVGYVDGYFPFNYEVDGELQGIIKEILVRQNLPFRFRKVKDARTGLELLENRTIDVMMHMTEAKVIKENPQLQTLGNYADIPFVLVTKNEGQNDNLNQIVTLSAFRNDIKNLIVTDNKTVLFGDSTQDCLAMVEAGEADAFMGGAYICEYLIRSNPNYSDLVIGTVLNGNIHLQMVVNQNADENLKTILVKSIGHISEKDITEFMLKHMNNSHISLKNVIRENSMIIVFVLILIILSIVGVTLHIINDSRKIQKLLYKDASMDIWNLHYFIKHLEVERKKDSHNNYAIVYTRILHMRQYNLIHGRTAAVKVYDCLMTILKGVVTEKNEICARLNDDHFLLLLRYEDLQELQNRLNQIMDFSEEAIYQLTDNLLRLELGVVPDIFQKRDSRTLIEYAIQVVDEDRDDINRRIHIYDSDFELQMKECHKKEQMLQTIGIAEHFEVYYQNKVDIRNEEIVGAEALIRFKDPLDQNKIKSPWYFVPYLEQIGRIIEIDFFVLESVCKMLRRRIDANLKVVPISCNFSRLHFTKAGFAQRFEEVLNLYHISKNLIEVEITETIVVEKEELIVLKENLKEMKEHDIRLAIDDFGSGYSSLGIFEHVPAAVIKMDRSFMVNHENGERQLKIMKVIVKLSEELNSDIVCEGVETEEDVALMRKISAYIAQGYFYSRPIPENEFEKTLG